MIERLSALSAVAVGCLFLLAYGLLAGVFRSSNELRNRRPSQTPARRPTSEYIDTGGSAGGSPGSANVTAICVVCGYGTGVGKFRRATGTCGALVMTSDLTELRAQVYAGSHIVEGTEALLMPNGSGVDPPYMAFSPVLFEAFENPAALEAGQIVPPVDSNFCSGAML